MNENRDFREYPVWGASLRWFHWINALTVLCQIFVGLIMLFKKELGITGLDAKIGLKELHVIIGYVFVINLIWRLVMMFRGDQYNGWRGFIPTKGYTNALKLYLISIRDGHPRQFKGHNPLGRLAVCAIYSLLIVMAITGLIRAGTDIYYPPFGSMVAEYVAKPGVDPDKLIPYDKSTVDEAKSNNLNKLKRPAGTIHLYGSYVLMFIIVLHVFAVVLIEIREGGGITSAMFSGKKLMSGKPADLDGDPKQ